MSGKDVSESTENNLVISGESLKGKLVQGEQDEQRLEENAETAGAPAVTRARRRMGRPADQRQDNKYADRGIEQMHL